MDDKLENVIQKSLLELVANMIAQDESQNKKNIEDIYQDLMNCHCILHKKVLQISNRR
jgi:hypothetical protein